MRAERARTLAAALVVAAAGAAAGVVPLLVGPPGGDDAYYHAMNAQQHSWCWRHGVVHPRWYPGLNAGLGGPEPRTRALAPLLVQAAFAVALDDAVGALALASALIPPLAGVAMFLAVRRRAARLESALLAGTAWALAPYLLLAVHTRASLQEAWALALLPAVLAPVLDPARAPGERPRIAPTLLLALLIATHLLVAAMAGALLLAAALPSPRRLAAASRDVALALALAAVSWLPSVAALRYTASDAWTGGWVDWRRRFVLGGDDPDPELAAALLPAFVAVAAAAVLLAAAERDAPRTLAAGGLGAALLATPLARPLWELVPGMAFLQFPWRWLAPATCLVVIAAACAQRVWARRAATVLVIAPLLATPLLGRRLPGGEPLRPSDAPAVAARAAARFGVPAILPSYPANLPRGVDLGEALAAGREARAALPAPLADGPREWRWAVTLPAAREVHLPLLVDPAWRATVDGVPTAWRSADGLVAVAVPAGAHDVRLRQAALPEDSAGVAITLTALGCIAFARRRRTRPAVSPREALPPVEPPAQEEVLGGARDQDRERGRHHADEAERTGAE